MPNPINPASSVGAFPTRIHTWLMALATWLMGSLILAQPLVQTRMPNLSKMPSTFVHRILSDRNGYMWYATNDAGLCRDNGYQIDVVRAATKNDEPFGRYVICLSEDSVHGRIWFGTTNGLCYVDETTSEIIKIEDETLGNEDVSAVLASRDGKTIWAAHWAFIYQLDEKGNVLRRYESKALDGTFCAISNFYEDSGGRVWATQWKNGLLSYDNKKDSWVDRQWKGRCYPNDLIEDSARGCFWVATWGEGVLRYYPAQNPRDDKLEKCADLWTADTFESNYSKTIELVLDHSGRRLWTTTQDGMYVYEIDKENNLRVSSEIQPQRGFVDDLHYDGKGNVWVAGNDPGTMIYTQRNIVGRKHVLEDVPAKLHVKPIIDMMAADKGNGVWALLNHNGIVYYDIRDEKCLFLKDDMPEALTSTNVLERCRDGKGVWTVFAGNLYRLTVDDTRQCLHYDLELKDGDNILSLADNGENLLWLGSNNKVVCYDRKGKIRQTIAQETGKAFRIVSDLGNTTAYVLTERKGLLKVTAEGEVDIISGYRNFTSMALDKTTGSLWLSTDDGRLMRVAKGKHDIEYIDVASNKDKQPIVQLDMDDEGCVWIVTNQSVKVFNPRTKAVHVFSCMDDGIEMGFFKCLDAERLDGKAVMVGGAGAVCELTTENLNQPAQPTCTPRVTTVWVDDVRQMIGDGMYDVCLRPTVTNVEVMLSTLDILHADEVAFAYRIPEMGNGWIYLSQGDNVIRLTNLHKGDYTIEVMATDHSGNWGSPVKCIVIHRKPAWWESWWALTLYWVVGTALLCVIIYGYVRRQRQRRNEIIDQQMTEFRFRFFTNVSHELRTPLSLILSPVESLMNSWSEEKARELLPLIRSNAENLKGLVNRLLDFRRIESGDERLNLRRGDLLVFLRNLIASFRPMAEKCGIFLHSELQQGALYVNFDAAKMRQIMNNLLSNALKYTNTGGEVTVSAGSEESGWLTVKVNDTGVGIPAKDLPHVFDRYFQSSNREEAQNADMSGFGIGLHIVREYVEMHGGYIIVESEEGKGSTFMFKIPFISQAETADDFSAATEEYPEPTEYASPDKGSPTLLLVDDNEDFRMFLTTELRSTYHVLQASDGEEALRICKERQPNIVVSDVMMPVMDGFELCKQIKSDNEISHILVILLTAKAGQESELEGYHVGADFYISKPFNMAILRNRLAHLLESQRQRFDRFARGKEMPTAELATSPLDKELLDKAVALVEQHIADEAYSVEAFSSDMCMSRMNLYRKIHGLTGQSPLEFMKTIRLRKAAALILEKRLSVTEIAEQVGFATVRNFRKSFKDMYGVSPSEYKIELSI